MAETLRRIVNIGSFSILQDKLETWLDDYYINTCDQNAARCCEILELNAKVQGQLFKLLSLTASEGGLYGVSNIIKSRLLPWLGQNYFAAGGSMTGDKSLSVLAEAASKDRELNDMQDMYERSMGEMEDDVRLTRQENDDLRLELHSTKDELDQLMRSSSGSKMLSDVESRDLRIKLDDTRNQLNQNLRASTSDKMFNEVEARELRRKLADAQDEIVSLRAKANDYERQSRALKDDLYLAGVKLSPTLKKSSFISSSDVIDSLTSYRYLPRTGSPLSPNDPVQKVRETNMVSRFNDMFAQDRLDAMDTLRRYSDDHENNQRIINQAIQEAFSVTKLAFRQFKMKVRANLAATHIGPETLEEAVQDYINRNTDLYDLPGMVSDVIRGLIRNPKIFLPPGTSYSIIQPLIREACKIAWQMSSLAHPLDITMGTDGELMDEYKYRRSYDSEYTAPLINHHVWPCLQQGAKVLMKGEAVTRRGAGLGSPRRSRSPTRFSTVRSRSPSPVRARSRSPSPRRSMSPLRSTSPYRK